MNDRNAVLLPALLKQCGRLIDRHIDQLLKGQGIARSQYRVLYYVQRFGEPTQKELSEVLNVQGSTLTLIVDTLVQKGWLERHPDKTDRRVKRLRLTTKGRALYDRISDPVRVLNRQFTRELSETESQELSRQLHKIIDLLS